MKFLITGVSGFVGEEIVNYLEQNPEHSILGIDRNKDLSSEKIIFKKCDLISETDKLKEIFKD